MREEDEEEGEEVGGGEFIFAIKNLIEIYSILI
jgi:hypothetical protein